MNLSSPYAAKNRSTRLSGAAVVFCISVITLVYAPTKQGVLQLRKGVRHGKNAGEGKYDKSDISVHHSEVLLIIAVSES